MVDRRLAAHAAGGLLCALMLSPLAGCVSDARSAPPPDDAGAATGRAISLTDDGGHGISLAGPARRIISLVPSATETLIAIGATSQIVGRTRYDVAPEVASVPSVGGGIDPSAESIVALHPDLVVSWSNDKRQLIRQKLTELGVPVFVMRTEDTSDVFRGIANLGRLTGHDSAARALAAGVRGDLTAVRQSVAGEHAPTVFYVVYNDPPMTTGPATFIGQLIGVAGGRSVFGDATQLWPTVSMEEIVRRDPDILIVPVGEFRSNTVERFRKMAGWRDLRAVRTGHVVAVPANLVNRPSPGIAGAARVLRDAMHPAAASTP